VEEVEEKDPFFRKGRERFLRERDPFFRKE
jgi:hypothetical protein